MASKDLEGSLAWYSAQQPLAARFLQVVHQKLDLIAQQPRSYPIKYNHKQVAVRSAPLRRFPFIILYFLDDTSRQVVVLAVWHTAQNPLKWEQRL